METHSLKLQKTIEAQLSDVYNAFADASELSKWFTTNARADLRAGGKYSNDDMDEGTFLEIVDNKKLRFTWDNRAHCPGTEVTVSFEAKGRGKTLVMLVHSKLETKKHVKDMKSGWSWALYNVKLFLETGKTIGYEKWLKSVNRKKK
jgi:uncharacterized protein YndB with AHSA1/START domain